MVLQPVPGQVIAMEHLVPMLFSAGVVFFAWAMFLKFRKI
jgi:hypothetical protein